MGTAAITIQGLSKRYRIGAPAAGTFYDLVSGWLRPSRSDQAAWQEEFWALRDVDLEVGQGEVLGVVGRNGAGKSTLLKILSRITAPTSGRVTLRGRVASLLEVGTGFHPELTGRENILLNATILGMKRLEIERKFDAIVAFSGVEKFLDTPVKRYSSGMYVRLAFAVAAHVDADILLVDEVLAVGDAEFQKRCLGMMGDVARAGRTVLFVSHNLTALTNLCSTGILLQQGCVAAAGDLAHVLERYVGRADERGEVVLDAGRTTADARVSRVAVCGAGGSPAASVPGTQAIRIEVDVEVACSGSFDVFLHCHNEEQVIVWSGGSFLANDGQPLPAGMHRFVCELPPHLLNDGAYSLDAIVIRGRQEIVEEQRGVLLFHVSDDYTRVAGWHWRPPGTVRPRLHWRIARA